MIIAYRLRWRLVVCHIVIRRVGVYWILHFTLNIYIYKWLRDALPMDAFLVVISHMRVLQYDMRGETMTMSDTVRITAGPVTSWEYNEGTRLLKWDLLVVTKPDDQPFLRV